jgi:uncharacterized membrane protein HdeD (DUF308 family)
MHCTGWTTLAAVRKDTPRKFMRPLALSFNLMMLGIGVWLLVTPAYEMALLSRPFGTFSVIVGVFGMAGLIAAIHQPKNHSAPDAKPISETQPDSSNA